MCCYKNSSGCGCGCTGTNCPKVSSDTVQYIGPNLPATGIDFNDTLTIALQKIEELVAILNAQVNQTQQTTTTTTTV